MNDTVLSIDSMTKGVQDIMSPWDTSSDTPPKLSDAKVSVPLNQKHKQLQVPFVNLFKNNRMANENHKIEFLAPGTNRLKFTFDDNDSVEKKYDICLLGYIISGKPPTSALMDLVRRWGKEVQFQTHSSAWIAFKFKSIEDRDRVLSGGPYLVYDYPLFLKDMPRCFQFRDEDMNSLPSWVQIHGIPPDCWNHLILSNIASEIEVPIHMDMLTHERKRMKYARVLIEINLASPRIHDITVELPIGNVTVKFVYEHDIKFCKDCHIVGHDDMSCPKLSSNDTDMCKENATAATRGRARSKTVVWWQRRSRGGPTLTIKIVFFFKHFC